MKFFIPDVLSDEQAKQLYEGALKFSEDQTGWKVLNSFVFAVRYRHDGKEYLAQVGEKDPTDGLVMCIFECPTAFLVCTPNRGVFRGFPILVGRSDVSDVEYFDS